MKHLKTFGDYINEASLPFKLEKELTLAGVEFVFDEERTTEDDDNRLDFVEVYVGEDRRSGAYYVIKIGTIAGSYYLEIEKNEQIEFSNKYPRAQKAYFDQDCVNSLGFVPEIN